MTNANTIPAQASEVQYRKAKLWQIILVACNALNGMAVYFLIGLASYSASIGYGIATMVVGGLLTFTRIFDMPVFGASELTHKRSENNHEKSNSIWWRKRPFLSAFRA